MGDILIRSGCFICMIILGAVLRRTGFLKKEDFYLISKIVVNITLTCAIITNLAGKTFDLSMLPMVLIGFGFGVLLAGTTALLYRKKDRGSRAFAVLNVAGCNVSNFALPFISGFLSPEAIMATSLFDVGNSVICLGGMYSLAKMIKDGSRFSLKSIGKTISRSMPFMTYMVMFLLSILHVAVPAPVTDFTGMIGSSNTFLAMFMLGIGFNIRISRGQVGNILRVLGIRYTMAAAATLLVYFVLPLPEICRQTAVLIFFAPIASAAPAFTAKIDEDYETASVINSISILVGIMIMTVLLVMIR